MKANLKNIKAACKDDRRFAEKSSNSGVVEFTHAVRQIQHDFFDDCQNKAANGEHELYKFIQRKMQLLGWNNYQFETFGKIVKDVKTSYDIESGIRGMLIYAEKNSDLADKANFIEWLHDELAISRGIADINTSTTKPENHFECCEGMSWDELAEYWRNN